MVGSGFYLSPSALAPYGILAILSWVVMGGGAICLGLTFARLSRLSPATGGPYAYSRMGFGDFAGFLVAWGYWISIWASLPAIAVAFTGSLFKIVPMLQGNRPMAVIITIGVMWLIVFTNLRGVKEAGLVAEVTTYSKLVPVRRAFPSSDSSSFSPRICPSSTRAVNHCSRPPPRWLRSRCSPISVSSRRPCRPAT